MRFSVRLLFLDSPSHMASPVAFRQLLGSFVFRSSIEFQVLVLAERKEMLGSLDRRMDERTTFHPSAIYPSSFIPSAINDLRLE